MNLKAINIHNFIIFQKNLRKQNFLFRKKVVILRTF